MMSKVLCALILTLAFVLMADICSSSSPSSGNSGCCRRAPDGATHCYLTIVDGKEVCDESTLKRLDHTPGYLHNHIHSVEGDGTEVETTEKHRQPKQEHKGHKKDTNDKKKAQKGWEKMKEGWTENWEQARKVKDAKLKAIQANMAAGSKEIVKGWRQFCKGVARVFGYGEDGDNESPKTKSVQKS